MRPEADADVIPIRSEADSPPPSEGGSRPAEGGGERRKRKPKKPIDFGRYNELLEHFVLVYGTDTVFDCRERMIIKINALRLAFGSDYVKMWLNSPERRMILPDQLVFDPTMKAQPPAINLFDGFALTPEAGECAPMLELIGHLCSESSEAEERVLDVVEWVLNWLAYPLQYPGAKMATALVFHGPQGAGKNLFFEGVAEVYGKYAMVVGQDQLEDRFNDWASQKLLVIGDEVVARAELYHQKNKLKSFITGETIQINAKMLPLRTEANHVNVVFLSNEVQPLALEPGDRRYLVIYTPPARQDDLYARVAAFLKAGGARRFMHYLLNRDLAGFSPHSKPLMTTAKADLIELGLKPPERFCREWLKGYLPLPLQVCSAEQLYRAFRRWCALTGERFPPPQVTFTKGLEKVSRGRLKYTLIKLEKPDRGKVTTRMWVPEGCGPKDDQTAGQWATEAVENFERALADFTGDFQGAER